jgi:UDP-4-amino-4,6-dideoxy-L-N-acetyl-beta-L-altrosamine transaminase
MINLFNIENYKINTEEFSHLLHDEIVTEFEEKFCEYVEAKYACSINSATNAIFLTFLGRGITIDVPSVIPPVVCNGIITGGNSVNFVDNTEWVGDSYILHEFEDYKVIDSAQKVERNQFLKEANDQDLMIFSFYPTKPIGSCDGGIIVSNDWDKIQRFKESTLNGMTFSKDNWDRKIKFPGYKMYMNSFQARIAMNNLNKLDEKNEKLAEVRNLYNQKLGLNNQSSHLYRINVNNRDNFASSMKLSGVHTGVHYAALHENEVYCRKPVSLPKSSQEGQTTISIPFHEKLTNQEINYIIEKVKKYAA